ncbi:hypothetical protein ZWY2020_037583 [Hordeum vulgare]|nr:hypothetical protein ZWY2020_037583 [Hordeum vulgare]
MLWLAAPPPSAAAAPPPPLPPACCGPAVLSAIGPACPVVISFPRPPYFHNKKALLIKKRAEFLQASQGYPTRLLKPDQWRSLSDKPVNKCSNNTTSHNLNASGSPPFVAEKRKRGRRRVRRGPGRRCPLAGGRASAARSANRTGKRRGGRLTRKAIRPDGPTRTHIRRPHPVSGTEPPRPTNGKSEARGAGPPDLFRQRGGGDGDALARVDVRRRWAPTE